MSNRPTHDVLVPFTTGEGDDAKTGFNRVGAAWRIKDGQGLKVIFHQGLSVTGEVVILPAKEQNNEPS